MARKRINAEPSGFSILVVDDQEETIISSKLLLEREGHRVETALGGLEALKLFREHRFDLAIIDYFMPQMNGEELVRAIRNIDSEVQIILQTGYSGEKPPREMLKLLDIQGYHDKSEGPDRLLLWVDVALKAARHLGAVHRSEKELLASRGQLRRLSARLLAAQEEERERISRELHDQLGQLLTAIGLDIDWASRHVPSELQSVKERLGEANGLVRRAIADTRELCATLRPGELRGPQLIEEIRTHATESAHRAGFTLSFMVGRGDFDFSEQCGRNIYRIVQEAVSNIIRHASASEVTVDLTMTGDKFILTIADNGVGFRPERVSDPHAVGLTGMRERAHLIGARLHLESSPGNGTTIRLEIPTVMCTHEAIESAHDRLT
ncbi:MAG TPA: response regulator [Candidatus Binataceae bacterium]|nr:response regulator [Candidatus Binataceae bacterium]